MDPTQNVYDVNAYPRRVIRFVPELEGSLVARLLDGNILLIDKSKFDLLSKQQRELVYVARSDMVFEAVA